MRSRSWRADGTNVELRAGTALACSAAPVPLTITARTPSIVRVEIGPRAAGSATSFLPEQERAPAPAAAHVAPPKIIDTGILALELTAEPPGLSFADRPGHLRLRLPLEEVRLSPRPQVRLEVVGEQHFYGLGESGQPFDRLGISRRLWNNHVSHGHGSDIAIPLLLSHQGYALFFDNSSLASVDVGRSDGRFWIEYESEEGPLDLYYLGGVNLREVLGEVATLLGRAPMPPRWALGYLQSTRHFEDQDELRRLPEAIREKGLPCDALIFLSTYGEALGWNRGVGHLECEPTLLPEPASFFAELRGQHFHVITHEYPVLHPDSPLYQEAEGKEYLLDAGYAQPAPGARPPAVYQEGQRYLDFSQREVRKWWWRQHRSLCRYGVDGWWLDGGEGPPSRVKLRGGAGTVLHNRYDLMRQQAFEEGEAADRPDGRVFLLCRSGGAGMQRHGGACWSGDINNTFGTLEAQLHAGLSMALSGVPYWGTDIGGFYHAVPETGELFARWFQFGAFCPVFRAHGRIWREHLPWAHGSEVEGVCRRFLELRYRFMPYTYTLAWQAHRLGLPLMRPLVLNYPEDPCVWDLASEYMWGDDVLVAPVTRAGATHWPVYLPAGTWYDFWTHERHDGPCGVSAAAPLERLPLFVRAGAILPLGPAVQYHDEQALTDVTLLVYGGTRSSFTLYEDDGMTRAYERGRYALTEFECDSNPERLTLRIASPRGEGALIPAGRAYTLQVYALHAPRSVTHDARGELPRRTQAGGHGWWHDGGRFLFVRMPHPPAAVTIVW